MSFLIDTDLLSMLERKSVPRKLALWVEEHESEIFLSVVSLAELQHGLNSAPEAHREALRHWLSETRQKLAPAMEEVTEGILVRWKELLGELKTRKRTMSCEDSLIAATALYHGHTVATRNKRHFEVAGVKVIDPLA